MRVAIVGTGGIAETHAKEVRSLGHEIVLAVDTDKSKGELFAKRHSIERVSTDFESCLESDVQVVHLCTPPTLHYEMAKAIMEAGKHVICEKPLSLDADEAKVLMDLGESMDLVHGINFNVRFHEACQRIKNLVASEDFGEVRLIHGSYLQEFHVLPTAYSWRYNRRLGGDMRATTEIGSHWIDLARYLTGLEIVEVSANFGKFNPSRYLKENMMYAEEEEGSEGITVESEDAALISMRLSNGAIGNVVLSEVSHGRSNRVAIEITGSKQSVWWNNENPYLVSKAKRHEGINQVVNAFGGGFPTTFKDFFAAVYKTIECGRPDHFPSYPTFRDGYINALVCRSIYESAQDDSRWVKVLY